MIRRLRALQMPVADVKATLAAPESATRNELIVDHLDRLEAELAQTRAAVDELRDLLQAPRYPEPIEHRTVDRHVRGRHPQVVDRDESSAWWQGALGELHATVRAQKVQPTGPLGGLYASELFQHGRGEATVFVPVGGPSRPSAEWLNAHTRAELAVTGTAAARECRSHLR